ncbi:MAG: toll/interleukin-1 receptor domain-containing protein [Candidatus Dadabacteria bacterium]|nr:toll/interleukin-1 receptor domain-containing protein [Candidatus Dadabacteria bacterium]NIS38553.1 toll/interleukin-1 receptor domain-containing protein [Candidatus Saccharibacteria bacterium]NIU01642.1 toll/interleukin-1 receptor domain-containing protein [Nitrosopumilaceae archaeon]NIV03998.1 TIR domain-containing protein [Calditrichia bacterium]NIX62244.1 TIR domain-containing protein [Nitrosopumilaceae archaeon]
MAYKVFISHSARDQGLVVSLANLLTKFGAEVIVAEWYLTPGARIDEKVSKQIRDSDCVIVLLTKNGVRSSWVQQEIGLAINGNKLIIPLVEKRTGAKDLAALQGKEYIEYDPSQPQQALAKASEYVNSLKLKKEEQQKKLMVAGAILAFLLLLSGGEK